MLFLIADWWR